MNSCVKVLGITLLVAISLTVSWTGTAWAAAPRVTASVPADGARDVPVTQGKIVINFNRNMKMNAWSLLEDGVHPFPPLIDSKSPWQDERTFVILLKVLAPGTTYAVQLNSAKRQGFQAAEDQAPLPVTVITFTTGGDPQPHAAQPPAASADAGASGIGPSANSGGSPQFGKAADPSGPPSLPGLGQARPAAQPPKGSPAAAPARTRAAADPRLPSRYNMYRYIDQGGIRDRSTGRFLEAFHLLVPAGWKFDGGIRWQLNQKGVMGMDRMDFLVPARVAFTVTSPDGRVAMQVYPEEHFVDTSRMPAAQFGAFQPGSRYMGAIVSPPLNPAQYVVNYVIPYQRGQLPGARVVEQKAIPQLAQIFQHEADQFNAAIGNAAPIRQGFQAAAVTVDYSAGGQPTREIFLAVMLYIQMPEATLWWPRMCVSVRAPAGETELWMPVLMTSLMSIRFDTRWIVELMRMVDQAWQKIQEVDAYIAKIDAEIVASRQQTNNQIQREMYPRLAPFCSKRGPNGEDQFLPSDQDHYQNPNGDVCTNPPPGDPNWKPMKEIY
jgi:hypothetical protein